MKATSSVPTARATTRFPQATGQTLPATPPHRQFFQAADEREPGNIGKSNELISARTLLALRDRLEGPTCKSRQEHQSSATSLQSGSATGASKPSVTDNGGPSQASEDGASGDSSVVQEFLEIREDESL